VPELHLRFKGLETTQVVDAQYFSEASESSENILPAATAALYQKMLLDPGTLPNSLVAQVNALHRAYTSAPNALADSPP